MISLIEQNVEPSKAQKSVLQRVSEYLATGRPLDLAPDSILEDVDRLWRMKESARERGAKEIRLSRELHQVARARAFGQAIAPLSEGA